MSTRASPRELVLAMPPSQRRHSQDTTGRKNSQPKQGQGRRAFKVRQETGICQHMSKKDNALREGQGVYVGESGRFEMLSALARNETIGKPKCKPPRREPEALHE